MVWAEASETEEPAVVLVVAAPFRRAAPLRRFVAAVRSLPGVQTAEMVDLRHGALSLAVTYADAAPLGSRLRRLPGFALEIEDQDGRISVALPDESDGWD